MREKFWELPLEDLTNPEWEALCDGCGKCCLNKLQFEKPHELLFTRVACKLLDGHSCRCKSYPDRHDYVPDCVVLTLDKIEQVRWWLPRTCAYRLRAEGKPLEDWHPLISNDPESVHWAGISVRGRTISETEVREDDWEDYVIEDMA